MLLLVLLVVPLIEVLAFIAVGLAIGWLAATALLLGISLIGWQLLRVQGRAAIDRVSLAAAERRAPAAAGIDSALALLGALLLVIPGFLTDAIGALLLLPPTRMLTRRWISRRYISRLVSFAASAGRFASGSRGAAGSGEADIDSTVIEDDPRRLGG
ncbi:MAG TPA: FxsA family protein [Solirubrobacteraceae bacterium]